MAEVVIEYTRLPDRLTVFRQQLVAREAGCVVTLMERTPLREPVRAGDRTILEPGAPVVWFTVDGAWHDIGRFHTADGRFTGCYANVLTPVRFAAPLHWSTTDLCLDVFLEPDGGAYLLDEDDLDRAARAGWLDQVTAVRAREEAARLVAAASGGAWPPAVVERWTLERARAAAGTAAGTQDRAPV
jgi:predicted RNA-binding protein associated with RNAse of E/G family